MDIIEIKKAINKTIDKLSTILDKDRFLKDQYETVLNICDNVLNNKKKSVLIEAPTGTGKSIISIIAAITLNSFGKTGYIITSDLQLQKQYEEDFKKLNLNFGSIKGVDNYNCTLNDEKFSIGECQQRGLSLNDIEELDCALKCPYMVTRRKAAKSRTALLNYSYWLLQLNYVNRDGHGVFKERDFCFFDEAHKISNIVQSHFSPMIKSNFPSEMSTLLSMIDDRIGYKNFKTKALEFSTFYDQLKFYDDTKDILKIISIIETKLKSILNYSKPIKERLKKKYPMSMVIPKGESLMIKKLDWLKDIHCKIEDFVEIIDDIGHDNIVKTISDENTIQLKNIEEKYLMKNHFHEHSNSQIFLSATIGDHETFCNLNMINDYTFIESKSLFNFKKSPICIYYPVKKMSYKEKDKSLNRNIKRIKNILRIHANDRGIIHSGSYKLTQLILSDVKSDRLIYYNNSKQKHEALKKLEQSTNGVLIGPSILEGVDLKDDLSRFQILMKVPYMSLSDEFVKKKMNKYPEWYQWNAIISMIQGLGRSIRNDKDYARSYILDGCANQMLITDKYFPKYITDRIHIVDDERKTVTKLNLNKSFIVKG